MADNVKRSINDSERFWTDYSEKYYKTLYKEVDEYPSLVLRHEYILAMLDKKAKTILDIGCGPGEMLVDLMKRGRDVTGIDISKGMLDVAKKNISSALPERSCTLSVGNIEKLESRDKFFDAVVCAGVLEYLSDDDKALSELNRVLKNDGYLIVSVRNKFCPMRIFDTILDKLKANGVGRKLLSLAKRLVAGGKRAEIRFTPYRKHSPWDFDRTLKRYGFEKKDFRFFHFYPFFTPFDKLFPSPFIKLGLRMEYLTNTSLGWLGSGYIVMAQKKRDLPK